MIFAYSMSCVEIKQLVGENPASLYSFGIIRLMCIIRFLSLFEVIVHVDGHANDFEVFSMNLNLYMYVNCLWMLKV